MKALLFQGPRDIVYGDFADPVIDGDDQAIIRVNKCSICGSDLHIYHGMSFAGLDFSKPQSPFCVGHEFMGEIVEVGAGVKNRKPGDRVISSPGFGCGKCAQCKRGMFNACEASQAYCYGVTPGVQGGQAEYVKVHQADVTTCRLPDFVTDEQALLLTDALSTGYYGAKRARISEGSTVAVIGMGPVGRMAAESAFALGAERVFAIDPVESRREAARTFGAVPLTPEEACDAVMAATKGVGADHVVEAVGYESTVKLALRLARRCGDVGIVGVLPTGLRIAMDLPQFNSLSISPAIAPVAATWPEIIALIEAGRIRGDNVFSHSFQIMDGAAAYELFESRSDGVMKIMIDV